MYTSYMGRARAGPWVLGRCPGAGPAAAQGLGRFGEHVCVRVRAAARALGPAVINVCEHVCVRVRMVFVNTVCEHLVHEHCSSKP